MLKEYCEELHVTHYIDNKNQLTIIEQKNELVN